MVRKGELLFVIDPKPFQAAVARAQAEVAEATRGTTGPSSRSTGSGRWSARKRRQPAGPRQRHGRRGVGPREHRGRRGAADHGRARPGVHPRDESDHRPRRQPPGGCGSYVGSPQPTVLTVVSVADPMRFDFNIAETEYLAYARCARERREGSSRPRRDSQLELADGSMHPYPGPSRWWAAESPAKPARFRCRRSFPIPNGLLRPGQFGRLKIVVSTRQTRSSSRSVRCRSFRGRTTCSWSERTAAPRFARSRSANRIGPRLGRDRRPRAGRPHRGGGIQKVKRRWLKVRVIAAKPTSPAPAPAKQH